MKNVALFWCLALLLISCGDDDEPLIPGEVVPPRLLSEVTIEDDAAIREYLETHFYNYEEFLNPSPDFDFRVRIAPIAGENADKIPLIQQVRDTLINVSSSTFGLDVEENDIPHKLYYLVAEQGEGVRPSIADSVYVSYEASRLTGEIFDSNLGTAVWLNLQATPGQAGAIKGFQEGITRFRAGAGFQENDNGTFTVQGFGSGVIFMPSGLGYFISSVPGAAYAPLIFNINLFAQTVVDHDRDGIPSIEEDRNNDRNLLNDDTDGDNAADYIDVDDDNDGIFTRDEITDENGTIIIPYPDTDGDGVPDYLDPDNG